uniref:DNA polymerase sliding clamp n=1 Tax=Ignisphaera aggregans TaxID=334771 RepID=A0A7C5XP14_9CREN
MSIKFIFADARIWRYVLRTLADYMETIGIRIHPSEGVRIKAMDPSHVMLIDFYIPVSAFEEYNVEKEATLLINLENTSKILRRASKSDKLMVLSDGSKLVLGFISKGGTLRSFITPLLSGSYEEVPELSLEFQVQAKILGTTLSSALSILEDVGDVLKFKVGRDGLSLIASSDLGEVEFIFSIMTGTLMDYQITESFNEFTNIYTMEYISILTPLSRLSEVATIKLGQDMPCEVELEMIAGARLKFYVAPRVE